MIIRKKRVRNLDRHLLPAFAGVELRLGVSNADHHAARLRRAGFCGALGTGETVLPAMVGPVTRYNAEGRYKVRRDLPMETAYRQVQWTRVEFHGRNEVEVSETRDVPYRRYPREFIAPPALELTVALDGQGRRLVVTEALRFDAAGRDRLLHAVNVCLEVFGECEVFTGAGLASAVVPPAADQRRLNWQVLPPGRYPWERVRRELAPVIEAAKSGKRPVISQRLETVSGFAPEFVAVGAAGFAGYVVFGFPARRLFLLESAYYGNATYVFDRDWEELSRMTKAEILDQDLQRDRIIHREGWADRVGRLFV